MLKTLLKSFTIFTFGGILYSSIEILFKGSSHWTMTLTGGLCFLLLCFISIYMEGSIWKKSILGACIITCVEFMVGILVNEVLGWEIWDYSAHPFNYMGQICLEYSLIWFALSAAGIWLSGRIYRVLCRMENKYIRRI